MSDIDWTNPYQTPPHAKIAINHVPARQTRTDRLPVLGQALPDEHWNIEIVEDAGTTGYVDVVEAKTEKGTTVYFARSAFNKTIASGTQRRGYSTPQAAAAAARKVGHVPRDGVRQHPYTLDVTFDERNTP